MTNKTNSTKQQILELLQKSHNGLRPVDLVNELNISQQMVHRHIKDLLADKKIKKIGKSPRTYYVIGEKGGVNDGNSCEEVNYPKAREAVLGYTSQQNNLLNSDVSLLIEDNFLYVTPTGTKMDGVKAFEYWCNKRGFNVLKMAQQYKEVLQKYEKVRRTGLLDATSKVQRAFTGKVGKLCLDKLFYVDFYALETFGKTKLGQMLLYAKQSQDKQAIIQIADTIKPKIDKLIEDEKIDAVAYIPPTVKRTVQFMKVLEQRLAIALPSIKVLKIIGDVAVPQKTLKKIEDRVENANASFVVESSMAQYNRVLLIDDAVGSGASLNQVACKLKANRVAKEVIGVAITGSLNNFDVISEV